MQEIIYFFKHIPRKDLAIAIFLIVLAVVFQGLEGSSKGLLRRYEKNEDE